MRVALLAACLLSLPRAAHAYLDPATGSVLLGLLSAVMSMVILLYEKLSRIAQHLFFSLRGNPFSQRRGRSVQGDVLLHCENASYIPLFGPLVRELGRENLRTTVLCTTDEEARAFGEHAKVKVDLVRPASMLRTILRSRSRLFVSTTPGLEVLGLRRSAFFQKCCYILHSPSDIHTYPLFSLDKYDAVLCCGRYQERSLRRLERLRGNSGRRRKHIVSTGLLYYDGYLGDARAPRGPAGDVLLIAPTWGKSSLIYHLSPGHVCALARSFERVIIRFHPQSAISDAPQRQSLIDASAILPNVEIDASPSSCEPIRKASSLLTDISGTILDFRILQPEGALYFLPSYFDFSTKEGRWLPWEPYEVSVAKRTGIEVSDLAMLESLKSYRPPAEREDPDGLAIDHIGRSAEPTAKALMDLLGTSG